MSLDGESLLEGPRGRRLCLELAMELDPDIRVMVFRLGYDLDSGRGTSRVLLTAAPLDDAGTPPAAPSPGMLAAALGHLEAADVDHARLQAALERAVDAARYWQPPDGEDVLAALPLVRAALLLLARHVIEPGGEFLRRGGGNRDPRPWRWPYAGDPQARGLDVIVPKVSLGGDCIAPARLV
jgi:hypothetical protein